MEEPTGWLADRLGHDLRVRFPTCHRLHNLCDDSWLPLWIQKRVGILDGGLSMRRPDPYRYKLRSSFTDGS